VFFGQAKIVTDLEIRLNFIGHFEEVGTLEGV
jgi:hypothetical protein